MGLRTYTSIVNAIKQVIEDDSAEVTEYIPTAIFLAEERVAKDMDAKELTVETSAVTSAITNVTIGTSGLETEVSTGIDNDDFLYFKNVYYNGEKLDMVDVSYLREINRYETSAGCSARYYGWVDKPDTIYVSPPVSAGKFSLTYSEKPMNISTTNTTNVITRKFPEMLFYGALVEMQMFMKNWETLPLWEQSYQRYLQTNLNVTRRERTDIGQKHFSPNETQSTTGGQ